MANKKAGEKSAATVSGILGVGLDATDGHKRVTHTDEMVIVGGSAETHEKMQETAIRFGEELEKRGKTLPETSVREAVELLRKAIEKTGR